MACRAVWDSSIVMSKFFEQHRRSYQGKRFLDLSAGCGLVGEHVASWKRAPASACFSSCCCPHSCLHPWVAGITLARLGAGFVTATDLPENLPLLERNSHENAPGLVHVQPYVWGSDDVDPLHPPFDVVCVCDCMYIRGMCSGMASSCCSCFLTHHMLTPPFPALLNLLMLIQKQYPTWSKA